jgi:hypothetical protein
MPPGGMENPTDSRRPYRRNPIFSELLPRLSDEQRAALKAAIVESNGVRNAVVVWDETGDLLDGHHRDELDAELRKEGYALSAVPVRRMSFADDVAAKFWVLRNQSGQRNLAPFDLALTILQNKKLVKAVKAEAQEDMRRGKRRDPHSNKNKGDWMQRLADRAGIGRSTIYDAHTLRQDKEMAGLVRRGKMVPSLAVKRIRSKKTRLAEDRRRDDLAKNLPRFEHSDTFDQIINDDVLKGLRVIPDESTSLVLTSPPYPILADKVRYPEPATNYDGNYPAYLDWLDKVWREAFRILRPGARLIVNIDNVNVPKPDNTALAAGRYELDWKTTMRRNLYADIYTRAQSIGLTWVDEILWWKEAYVGERPVLGTFPRPALPRSILRARCTCSITSRRNSVRDSGCSIARTSFSYSALRVGSARSGSRGM